MMIGTSRRQSAIGREMMVEAHWLTIDASFGASTHRRALTGGVLPIAHRPDRFVARRIFIARPGRPANVQISIRRSGKHDPGAGVPDRRRQSAMLGVEGPEDHPVRTNWDGGARFVMGVRVAVLRRAAEHVAKPW